MKKALRFIAAIMFALFIYFPWMARSPLLIDFLGGLCFLASFHVLLTFRQWKTPWNIAHLTATAILGIFLIVYVAHI